MKPEQYGEKDMTTVKCSICTNDMECPRSMLKAEKHICHICTDTLAYGVRKGDANEISKRQKYIERHKDKMLEMGMFIHDMSFGWAGKKDAQKAIDIISAIGERLEDMGVSEQEFDRIMKSVDTNSLETIGDDPGTEEGLIRIMNKVIFKGDWKEHVKWAERHGTEEDVEIIRKVMKG